MIRAGTIAALAALLPLAAGAAETGHHGWDYSVHAGPAVWGELDAGYAACGRGQQQSPVDISGDLPEGEARLSFAYKAGSAAIADLGHTIQVNVAPGSELLFEGKRYELIQFHFHTPSENTFEGLHYPLETHFVHRDADGSLAVVALMVRRGASGPVDKLPLPEREGASVSLGDSFDPSGFLPGSDTHVTFAGSLTTPPCSEGVSWIVLRDAVSADAAWISALEARLGRNNRPVNPLHGRILEERD